jgi:hypothetical protein
MSKPPLPRVGRRLLAHTRLRCPLIRMCRCAGVARVWIAPPSRPPATVWHVARHLQRC